MTVVQVALELGFACEHVDLLGLNIWICICAHPSPVWENIFFLILFFFYFVGREEFCRIKISALPSFIKILVVICLVLV